ALAGALAVVASGVLAHPVRIVVSLLLVGVTVAAAWDALVHRGVRRWAAAVLAVAALVLVLVLADVGSVVRIVLLVVLVVAAVAAAGWALDRPGAPVAAGRRTGPATRGVLFCNPRSGGGKVVTFGLEELARERGVEPVVLRQGDDLRALAEQAVAAGCDVLGMAGGDGSQALVADVARRHDVALVCVPAGTRNHFALDLGLDRVDVRAALDAFGDATEMRIDLAQVGDRVFVNNASLGVYAAVVQSDAYRGAKIATTARLLPGLVGPGSDRLPLRYDSSDPSDEPADVVLVSNNVYRLESLRAFGTRARLDAGRLGVVTVTVRRSWNVPLLMAAELTGRVRRFRGYRSWDTPSFVVESSAPLVDVGVDGEALRLAPPLHFRTLPGCLRVRVPLSASSGPRPVEHLAGVVPALLHVASGRPPARDLARP
ncbi:MAG: diacylglycerol kinase, partial [Actinomycetota bacterium]|nr:diacylglycerol kinase [Actinomycetota bacterium]